MALPQVSLCMLSISQSRGRHKWGRCSWERTSRHEMNEQVQAQASSSSLAWTEPGVGRGTSTETLYFARPLTDRDQHIWLRFCNWPHDWGWDAEGQIPEGEALRWHWWPWCFYLVSVVPPACAHNSTLIALYDTPGWKTGVLFYS